MVRAGPRFQYAILEKPKEDKWPDLLKQFAPLFAQETPSGPEAHESGAPAGEMARDLAASPRRVYARADTVSIQGKTYDRVTYGWRQPFSCIKCSGEGVVRITIGQDGFPVVWEALPSSDGPVLFISESFEKKAAERFGPPLPGRRLCAERSTTETPRVIVADVLPDGPVPMGPYVYLAGPPGFEIATLLCRCSPPRVDEFTTTVYYETLVMDEHGSPAPAPVREILEFRADLDKLLRWPID